jgi:hypothetical protein
MEYFLLRQDNRLENKIPFSDKKSDVSIKSTKGVEWIDYYEFRDMMSSVYFVSDKLKQTLEIYEKEIQFDQFMVNDIQYWKVTMQPCEDAINGSFEKAAEMKLIDTAIEGKHIAMIRYRKRDYLVVSLYVAESMLRRFMLGIQYVRLEGGEQ